jgi:NADH-quinone oxidoreductase subunit G
MAKIIIDGQTIETREGIPVLRAALEAGWDVPHYCYHPGLSIVASCRLCLMEMKMPNPKTQELSWSPKLVPSCQTPVKDGLECRFHSDAVRSNQSHCMEYFLLNHPLDCPVCDQAGECWLQDYSERFGNATSRMVDQKLKNPKKDVGPKTLLYQDRCVMCSRCVRFTDEISGTHELGIINRGSRCEIDVFPGIPLDNALQGNVVDICPVGSLLDKDFLFKRRVWELRGADSVCPHCATGCSIRIDHADDHVYRLKPRYNPKVNQWWMCDYGRFGYKHIADRNRLRSPKVRRGFESVAPNWEDIPDILRFRFEEHVREQGAEKTALVLSPFLACEEAWLLIRFLREVAPACTLVAGPVPYEGKDEQFPVGATGPAVKFTILSEKCPNRRGIELLLSRAGGNQATFADFVARTGKGDFTAVWLTGGYLKPWVEKELTKAAEEISFLVLQDYYQSELAESAAIVLPSCAWAEREGSFMNAGGVLQPFDWAVNPPEGLRRDGQYLYEIAGFTGLYNAERVREMMAESIPEFAVVYAAPPEPVHAH